MKVKGYKYCLIIDKKGVIANPNDFKQEINVEATVEVYDTFATAKGFNSLKQLEKYIKDNNLTFPEEPVEINPFESEWSKDYPDAKLRMYLKSIDANRLSIDMPEFVMYLKSQKINLEVDENYGVVWAYLQYIQDEHIGFLEAPKDKGGYDAKFQNRS